MRIGPYEVFGELGRGAMGVVYRARHTELGRPAALKVLAPATATTPGLVARFRREAQAAARLAAHEGIVGVHDVGEHEGQLWLAMDLVEGESLERLAEPGDLAPTTVARLGAQVARALAHAHANGVHHRDVKPANILVESARAAAAPASGRPAPPARGLVSVPAAGAGTPRPAPVAEGEPRARLADFGLAAVHAADARTTRLTRSGEIVGTAAYMPPEQARGETPDGRADIYALGATLYHVLAGAPPFPGDSLYEVLAALLRDPAPPLRRVAPAVPEDLAAVVDHCLERQPEDRYPAAEALAEDLERFARGEATLARARPAAARWLAAGRRRAAAAAAIVALTVAASTAWWAARGAGRGRSAALAETSGARSDAERATVLAAAWGRLQRDAGAALARLEDAWHDAPVPPASVDAALAEVRAAAARIEADAPRLAAAVVALGEYFADREHGAERLAVAARTPDAGPLARLCLARVRLAVYARLVAEPPLVLASYTVEVGEFRETEAATRMRAEAEAEIRAAIASPLWPLLPGVADVQAYAAAAERFAGAAPAAAARALAALADDPALGTEASFLAGVALIRAADFPGAAVAFERATRREWGDARRAAALAHFAAGSVPRGPPAALEAALAHMDARLAHAPGDRRALSLRGIVRRRRAEIALQAGADARADLRAARADYDAVLALGPANAALRHGRGIVAMLQAEAALPDLAAAAGEAATAAADLADAERLEPDDPAAPAALIGVHTLRARLARAGAADPALALDAAFAVATRVLQRWPGYRPALVARANAWRVAGEAADARGADTGDILAAARADWDAALALYAADPQALGERANVLHRLAERAAARGEDERPLLAEALADVAAALTVEPRRPDLWHVRANLHLAGAEATLARGSDPAVAIAAALDAYDRALALGERADTRIARGTAHSTAAAAAQRRGDDPEPHWALAQVDYDTALRLGTDDAEAHYDRGTLWFARADHAKSRGADPGPALAAALADYAEAIARRPDSWENHAAQAAVLVECGRLTEAVAAFQAALARNPEAPGVRAALLDLRGRAGG